MVTTATSCAHLVADDLLRSRQRWCGHSTPLVLHLRGRNYFRVGVGYSVLVELTSMTTRRHLHRIFVVRVKLAEFEEVVTPCLPF